MMFINTLKIYYILYIKFCFHHIMFLCKKMLMTSNCLSYQILVPHVSFSEILTFPHMLH